MAKFLCNAPYPGAFLAVSHRVIPPGVEFEVDPADEPGGPRNMWIPRDDAAKAWLKSWNGSHPADQRRPYPLAKAHLPQTPSLPRPDEKDSGF